MKNLCIIFPDQLNPDYSSLLDYDKELDEILMLFTIWLNNEQLVQMIHKKHLFQRKKYLTNDITDKIYKLSVSFTTLLATKNAG